MLRAIVAVTFGYVAMAGWIFFSLSLAWRFLGVDFAFQPGLWEVSFQWIALNLPLSFIGAAMGGFVCAFLGKARSSSAVKTLATMVVLIGMMQAWAQWKKGDPPSPPEGQTPAAVELIEIGKYARQPPWYNLVLPLIGATGVLAGGKLGERRLALRNANRVASS